MTALNLRAERDLMQRIPNFFNHCRRKLAKDRTQQTQFKVGNFHLHKSFDQIAKRAMAIGTDVIS